MTLSEMQRLVKNKALDFRALDRLVNSDQFARAVEKAGPESRAHLEALLRDGNKLAVESWMKQQLADVIEDQSVRQLRDMAKKLGVPYYHHLSKAKLIEALKPKETA